MGARAFTSTAGPGISLMSELIGLAYYAEIPAVIVDVQRVGPSTGMPTRTQQGDILVCAYASHGDTKHILLFPAEPNECFQFAVKSFDLAERFQTPVFMLTDLDIGMNDWVVPRLSWDDGYRPDRGRVLSREDLEKMPKFHRYSPEDERRGRGAHAARGPLQGRVLHARLGAQQARRLHRDPRTSTRRSWTACSASTRPRASTCPRRSSRTAAEAPEPRSAWSLSGGCDCAMREAITGAGAKGIAADYMRVRGFPFGAAVETFLEEHELVFVVEQNRDAQLRSLLVLETAVPKEKLRSVLAYGGFPLQATQVVEGRH